jgi:hypothetical protein
MLTRRATLASGNAMRWSVAIPGHLNVPAHNPELGLRGLVVCDAGRLDDADRSRRIRDTFREYDGEFDDQE